MYSRISFAAFFAFFIFILLPALSSASIYSWQDADGVIMFTDDLSKAPGNVKVKVLSSYEPPQADSAEPAAAPAPNQPSRVATEGEFVIRLVEELGLSDDPTAEEAADILTEIRVAPQLGFWELDRPMTEDLTDRLRKLAVAAAESGRITLTPDEVLLAFDTTAALLGLTIPVAVEPEDVSQGPVSLSETPPVVYVTSPPAVIYPYYTWVPVTGGFWWNGFLCSGFFVLDVNNFSKHRGFRGHRDFWDSGRIGRQFRNHFSDRRFGRNPGFSDTQRGHRRFDSGSASGPNRFSNRPSRFHDGSRLPGNRPSGTRFSGTRPSGQRFSGTTQRRHFSTRSMAPSSPLRSFNRHPARPPGRQYISSVNASMSPARQNSPVRYTPRPSPSRSFSNPSGRIGASIGQGTVTGANRGGSGFSGGSRSFRGR